MSPNAWDDLEDKIYEHQEVVISAEYGAVEADRANYGWGVTEMDDGISVETKIYGPSRVLVTTAKLGAQADDFEDEWRDY